MSVTRGSLRGRARAIVLALSHRLERPWFLRLAIATTFASSVFFYVRAFHTSHGDDGDVIRAVVAGPVICGLVWTLHRVRMGGSMARSSILAPRRLWLVVVGSALAWAAIWSTARLMVVFVAPGSTPRLDGGAHAAVAVISAIALNALVARVRRPVRGHCAASFSGRVAAADPGSAPSTAPVLSSSPSSRARR